MKKIIFGLLALAASATVCRAQTEFRHISFAEAQTAAKAEGKQIFIDFFTEWCGPCKRLAKLTFPDKAVGDYLNKNFVPLKIDAEKGEGVELAKKYGVKAYPTLLVLDADGNAIGSFAGFKEGEEFIAAIESVRNPELTREIVEARYNEGVRTPEIVQAYVFHMIENSRDYMAAYAKAKEIYDDYFAGLSDADKAKKENWFLYFDQGYQYGTPRAEYVLAHRDLFTGDDKEKMQERVKNLYQNSAVDYFTTNKLNGNPGALAKYAQFKKECAELGYAQEMKTMFDFTDKRAASDDKTYLAYLDKNFEKLSDLEQQYIVSRITGVAATDTPEQKKAVSQVVRNHIGKMSAGGVYNAAMAIYNLENEKTH